jgi:transposase
VLLVGIDVAKASWFVLGCDLHGSVVIDGTKVPADRAGLGQLGGLLDQARVRVGAQLVVVGVEAAGHYHQTLAAHLAERGDLLLRLVNPAAVAAVRKTQLNRRRKTDWLDAAAICDLLVRGEGSPFLLGDDAATALRPLWNGRKDLVDARARLRLQVLALVDCLWPGLSGHARALGARPVLRDLFTTKAGRILLGLLAQGWSPAQIAAYDVAGLKALFARHDCQLKVTVAARILKRAGESLPPHPAATAGKPALLTALLATLEALDRQVGELEATMAALLPNTEGAKLTQINGIGTVVASGFVAFVGSARRWGDWSKVWRGAGLDPARSQSGPTDVNFSISREGSAWGRRAVLDLASAACRKPGRWRDAYQQRVHVDRKPPLVALTATGNSVGRTCFALMLSGADYDPDHETRRRQRRHRGGRVPMQRDRRKAGGQAG